MPNLSPAMQDSCCIIDCKVTDFNMDVLAWEMETCGSLGKFQIDRLMPRIALAIGLS